VAKAQRPLADHRLFGVVVVVERRRRTARFGGDVGHRRREDALAGDDRSGGGVDGGLRPAPAMRGELGRPAGPGIGVRRGRHLVYLPGAKLNLMLDSDSDLRQSLPRGIDGSRKMIKPRNANTEFELGGINHVALVCSDMERTVDFYSNILGMPLIKSLDLP